MQSTRNHNRDSRQALGAYQLNYHESDRDVNSTSFRRGQTAQTLTTPLQSNAGTARAAPPQQTPFGIFHSQPSSSIQPPTPVSSSFFYGGHRERIDETVPEWLQACSPATDDDNPAPSTYLHTRTPSPPPPIPGAYDRNGIPAWRESQISGSFRRRDMDSFVSQSDYVPVTRPSSPTSGPSSRGSGNSFSSGGASCDSALSRREAVSRCEFCGREDLLSTLKDHWFKCPRRNARPSSRPGIWFGSQMYVLITLLLLIDEIIYGSVVLLRHVAIYVFKTVMSPFDSALRSVHYAFPPRIIAHVSLPEHNLDF